jgi:signal transduction histidine kinase
MKLLILLLLPILGYSQRFRMDMVVQRVDVVTNSKIPTRMERITLVLNADSIRIETLEESLKLTRVQNKQLTKVQRQVYANRVDIFIEKNNQLWHIAVIVSKKGFAIFCTPLFPHTRQPLYAINLRNI